MPLTGKRILITRTRQQASELARALEADGAVPILIPTIELAPPASFCALDAGLASLRSFDWLIFTSANAVEYFASRAQALGILLSSNKIAAIGPATARAVQAVGLAVDLVPPQYVAESLAAALTEHAPGSSMLLIRAEQARDTLPESLTAAGAQLTIASAYRNLVPPDSVTALQHLFVDQAHHPDAITFTSSSTATNLFALLETAGLRLPDHIVRASIGPVTSQTLRDLGAAPTIEAEEPTIASLCKVLTAHFNPRTEGT
jgi:uroporphyrinogen-III synthase